MQPVSPALHMPPPRPHPVPPAAGPGKSAQSVGHQAKAAVAAAKEAGQDLPPNAQGFAASRIAGGADPATIFAAIVEEPPTEPAENNPVPAAPVPEADAAGPETPPAEATPPAETELPPELPDDLPSGLPDDPAPDETELPAEGAPLPLTPAEAALALLSDGAEDEV